MLLSFSLNFTVHLYFNSNACVVPWTQATRNMTAIKRTLKRASVEGMNGQIYYDGGGGQR